MSAGPQGTTCRGPQSSNGLVLPFKASHCKLGRNWNELYGRVTTASLTQKHSFVILSVSPKESIGYQGLYSANVYALSKSSHRFVWSWGGGGKAIGRRRFQSTNDIGVASTSMPYVPPSWYWPIYMSNMTQMRCAQRFTCGCNVTLRAIDPLESGGTTSGFISLINQIHPIESRGFLVTLLPYADFGPSGVGPLKSDHYQR